MLLGRELAEEGAGDHRPVALQPCRGRTGCRHYCLRHRSKRKQSRCACVTERSCPTLSRTCGACPCDSRQQGSGPAGDGRPWLSLRLRSPHRPIRSEEQTSELQSLMRISYAVFCLKKKKTQKTTRCTQT